jgi:GT2 family glycosyltransferase
MPPDAALRVTTVIMTRNRWSSLQHSLPRHEGPVIVVDNGSTDGTAEQVRRYFPDVDLVALGKNIGVGARNVGVRRAQTPYVAFADDDSWWAPGASAAAAEVFDAHPRLAVLAARMLVGEEQTVDPVCSLMQHSPLGTAEDLPGPSVLGFLACGVVVRRSAFLLAGGFDEDLFFMGEEEKLALDLASAGWGLAYVDQVVAHHHPAGQRNGRRRATRQGRNRLLTAVMRRPWSVVARTVLDQMSHGLQGTAGLVAALPRLPRALVRRQVVPTSVERARRMLEEPQRTRNTARHPMVARRRVPR